MYLNSILYSEDIKSVANSNLPWDKLKNKTMLLTGAGGLIGTFLTDVLMYKNFQGDLNVKIIAVGRNKERAKERFFEYWNDEHFLFLEHDINKTLTLNEKANYIIHAASNTHPKLYANDPIGSLMTNVIGTHNLLEYAKNIKIDRFVFLSSVEIYGEALSENDVFDEKYLGYIDCNQMRAAYPEGKRAGEALCNTYAHKYDLDFVITRLSRVYGATMRLDDSKAMSQFIMKAVKGEDIVLKSKGEQRFSYCYVADAVRGILYAMFLGKINEAYNIADDSVLTLKEIAEYIAKLNNKKVVYDLPEAEEKQGYSKATVALLNTEKIKRLGFVAYDDLKTGVEKTIKILRN